MFSVIYYINVNVAKIGSKAENFLCGKREEEKKERETEIER